MLSSKSTSTEARQLHSRHGPPCPECDKPLRSPRARYCVACGFGMGELPGDVPPLVERRSDAFPFLRPAPR